MNKIFKIILIVTSLFHLTSCSKKIAKFLPNRPDHGGVQLDESMSVEFRQGWEDGCEVGMAAGSNTFYKMFYRSNAVDGYKMTSSSDYKTAWGNAFWYCYRFDHIKTKSAVWGSMFKGML
jgi:hypothetical protein